MPVCFVSVVTLHYKVGITWPNCIRDRSELRCRSMKWKVAHGSPDISCLVFWISACLCFSSLFFFLIALMIFCYIYSFFLLLVRVCWLAHCCWSIERYTLKTSHTFFLPCLSVRFEHVWAPGLKPCLAHMLNHPCCHTLQWHNQSGSSVWNSIRHLTGILTTHPPGCCGDVIILTDSTVLKAKL